MRKLNDNDVISQPLFGRCAQMLIVLQVEVQGFVNPHRVVIVGKFITAGVSKY